VGSFDFFRLNLAALEARFLLTNGNSFFFFRFCAPLFLPLFSRDPLSRPVPSSPAS